MVLKRSLCALPAGVLVAACLNQWAVPAAAGQAPAGFGIELCLLLAAVALLASLAIICAIGCARSRGAGAKLSRSLAPMCSQKNQKITLTTDRTVDSLLVACSRLAIAVGPWRRVRFEAVARQGRIEGATRRALININRYRDFLGMAPCR